MTRAAEAVPGPRPMCSSVLIDPFTSSAVAQVSCMGGQCLNSQCGVFFVQEKAKEKDREKLGEKEETIPPDYRLEEVKVSRCGAFLSVCHS